MRIKNEERPDAKSAQQNETKSPIGLENPAYQYREFSKEKALVDLNRPGKFRDKYGYQVVHENETRVVMACPMDEHLARDAKSKKTSDEAAYGTTGVEDANDGYSVAKDEVDVEFGGLDD